MNLHGLMLIAPCSMVYADKGSWAFGLCNCPCRNCRLLRDFLPHLLTIPEQLVDLDPEVFKRQVDDMV